MTANTIAESPADGVRVVRFLRPDVRPALYDSDALVRVVAASQLAKVGRPESIPHLEHVKYFDLDSDKAREEADKAILKLRTKYGIPDPAIEAASNSQLPPGMEDVDPASVTPTGQDVVAPAEAE